MSALAAIKPNTNVVLTKAFLNAGKALGLSQDELGAIIGRDRSIFSRSGIDPGSKPGELALHVIRAYRSLFALVGGQNKDIQHWMHTNNKHTGGVPAEQMLSIPGLLRIVEYLDAMRGKL